MLLYIHVPFCRKRCGYCSFFSVPLGTDGSGKDLILRYLSTLLHELDLWSGRLGRVPVETVFFGGGTPSILPAPAVAGILDRVRKVFALDKGAEVTLEANPESALAPGWLFEVKKAGANRLSLGIQSLDDAALKALGRAHGVREAEYAVEAARVAGFSNISLDLMWALPDDRQGQSQTHWLRQIKRAVELRPEHLSTYALGLEEDCPMKERLDKGEIALPTEREQASMYLAGADFLESTGFMQYEISNFARMGYECRHNLGYWEGADFLGIGPSATSTMAGRRWTNPPDLAAWQEDVRKGTPGAAYETLDKETRLREMLMLRLRTTKGLSVKEWNALAGGALLKDHAGLVGLLQKNGLAAVRKDRLRLTRSGMLVSNTILTHFFEKDPPPDDPGP